jgi:hypothetical protein
VNKGWLGISLFLQRSLEAPPWNGEVRTEYWNRKSVVD